MSEENKALLRRVYDEVMSGGNLDLLDEVIAPNMVDHESGNNGPEGVKEMMSMFRTAFPDLKVTVDDLLADGDKVIARATFSGTHKGEFMGIAGTGKRVDMPMIDIVRIENGKFAEHWGISDNMAMMQQLGAVPEMG
jgi:predicted ester cyclase